MNQYEKLIEAFTIFTKYPHSEYINAEHDEIISGPSPDDVSEEDIKRLDELGWHVDSDGPNFYYFT